MVYLLGLDLLSKFKFKINMHEEICIRVMSMQLSQGRNVICFESNMNMLISTVLISVKAGSVSISTRQYFLA